LVCVINASTFRYAVVGVAAAVRWSAGTPGVENRPADPVDGAGLSALIPRAADDVGAARAVSALITFGRMW